MCSFWVTMEHDEGDLEAVVRAGRGLACASFLGRNHPNNDDDNGNDSNKNGDPCYDAWAGFEPGPRGAAPDDGGSVQMGFPNLPMGSPHPGMDLQGLCSIPFYNGGVLMRSGSPLVFENVDPQTRPKEPDKKLCLKSEEFEPAEVAVSNPLEPINAPRKAEGGDANSPLAHPKPEPGPLDTATGPSPKNQGSKRRKTQQKRIVCVPAAGGSNRPSGEGLPSDLWAWRKYGQKPIKGSPYPRGYYRCSSSKGCSARKQVERSRTDPTMLVITYTSEHNHPWPTHRNALAGSTRQTTSAEKMASGVSQSHEANATNNTNNSAESSEAMAAENLLNSSNIASPAAGADQSGHGENQIQNFNVREDDEEQTGGLDRLFGATAGDHPHHDDDFFADLGELPESLNVLALRQFDDDKSDDEAASSMPMSSSSVADPFNLFNWSSSTFVDTETAM